MVRDFGTQFCYYGTTSREAGRGKTRVPVLAKSLCCSTARDSEGQKQFPQPPAYCLSEVQTLLLNEANKCCVVKEDTFVIRPNFVR